MPSELGKAIYFNFFNLPSITAHIGIAILLTTVFHIYCVLSYAWTDLHPPGRTNRYWSGCPVFASIVFFTTLWLDSQDPSLRHVVKYTTPRA